MEFIFIYELCVLLGHELIPELLLLCCCFTAKVMLGGSVNLTTLFLDRLRPPKWLTSTSCIYFG